MSKRDAGKGDRPRPVDRKKWDAWWDQYEKGKKDAKEDDLHGGEETDTVRGSVLYFRQGRDIVRHTIQIMGMVNLFKSRLDNA